MDVGLNGLVMYDLSLVKRAILNDVDLVGSALSPFSRLLFLPSLFFPPCLVSGQ